MPVPVKVKVTWIYTAPSRETCKALRHGSHSFTCKLHRACLYLVCIHQTVLPLTCGSVRLIAAYYSPIDSEKMKGWVQVSWPSWLIYCGRFTHISSHPSVQDWETLPVKLDPSNCCSSVYLRDQLTIATLCNICQGSHSPGKSGTFRELIWSENYVGDQGILLACERKRRFLSTFQGKVATH